MSTVSAPSVEGFAASFDGWVIHAPPGSIVDTGAITADEIELLEARCVQACEDQWQNDPQVTANCGDAGVFNTPMLLESPSYGARLAVPGSHIDGSGMFDQQSLACSLHDSCCTEFDEEDICPAAPRRVTAAGQPLHDGEEWRISVAGQMHASSPDAVVDGAADLSREIGYSFCTDGDLVSCPFYLGSMQLNLTGDLALELDCGSGPEAHVISDLTIDLAQPAFGIAEGGTSRKAFPPGAVVIAAEGMLDGAPVNIRAPIESAVGYEAGEGWTLLQGQGGAYLKAELPCGSGNSEITLWWGFQEEDTLDHPPSIGLNLPDTVACPGQLDLLLSTGADADGDLAELRWYVDGVLMEGTFPTIDFTEAHEIVAVLSDSRGAATSATKVVRCM